MPHPLADILVALAAEPNGLYFGYSLLAVVCGYEEAG